MAYWDGGSGTSDGRRIPPTVSARQISSISQRSAYFETEECVVDEAEDVVRNFIYEAYHHHLELGEDVFDSNIPSIPGLRTNSRADRTRQTSMIAQKLARIGNDINLKYRGEFQDMVDQLNLTGNTAYKVFADVAKRLFKEEITWGRISALMYFAYHITIKVIKEKTESIPQFLKLIISYVARFIKEKLAVWIANQGGWTAALQYSPSTRFTFVFIAVGGGLAIIAAVYYLSKRS